jgi:virginiamycin B lyase
VTATVDPNYPIWFTESAAGNLGLVNVGGFITELRVRKPAGAQPFGIVPGPAGEQAIWFTDFQSGNAIGRVNNQGHERAFALPQSGEQPATIVDGPDGALWFTEQKSGKIGRISIAGKIREYAIPHGARSEPFGIAAGADGALWFALAGSNRIGRIDTAGKISTYPVPTEKSAPSWIALGPDSALWFTEAAGNNVGRIDPSTGAVTEYPIPTAGSCPAGIAAGPDGAMWFTENCTDKVGRVSLS